MQLIVAGLCILRCVIRRLKTQNSRTFEAAGSSRPTLPLARLRRHTWINTRGSQGINMSGLTEGISPRLPSSERTRVMCKNLPLHRCQLRFRGRFPLQDVARTLGPAKRPSSLHRFCRPVDVQSALLSSDDNRTETPQMVSGSARNRMKPRDTRPRRHV